MTTAKTGRKRGNGEGTIKKRSDGRYEGQMTVSDGKRRSFYGKTPREVREKMAPSLRDVQQGLPVSSGRQQTLAGFLTDWLENTVKPARRHYTYKGYASNVRLHIIPTLGKLTLDKVTPQRIQALLNERLASGLSPRSVLYIRAVLRRALGQALKWGIVSRNAAALVDPPRLKRHAAVTLRPDEARTLMVALTGDRLEALVTVTLALGLRRGEVLGLHWKDADLEAGTLAVRGQYQRIAGEWRYVEAKTEQSHRTLAMPTFIAASLRAHRARQLEGRLAVGGEWQDGDLVFPTVTGGPQDGDSVSHQFAKRVRRIDQSERQAGRDGLPPVTLHGLRHSAATLLLAQGMSIEEIQKVLGHSQISLTADLYAHAAPEIMHRAADTMETLFGTG